MKEIITNTVGAVISIVIICAVIYGSYWAVKTLSYSFFYEDMVERTVTQMVKPESLKEKK